MSNTAAGGSNGIVPAGPSNKYEGSLSGCDACSSMSGNTDLNVASIAPIDHDAPDYPDSTHAGYALGRVPD